MIIAGWLAGARGKGLANCHGQTICGYEWGMNACTINYFLKINYHAYVAMLIVFKLSLLCSGILAGIFPDACTEETLKFMKMNFHADILVTDHKTLQTLLMVIITTVSIITWVCIHIHV